MEMKDESKLPSPTFVTGHHVGDVVTVEVVTPGALILSEWRHEVTEYDVLCTQEHVPRALRRAHLHLRPPAYLKLAPGSHTGVDADVQRRLPVVGEECIGGLLQCVVVTQEELDADVGSSVYGGWRDGTAGEGGQHGEG